MSELQYSKIQYSGTKPALRASRSRKRSRPDADSRQSSSRKRKPSKEATLTTSGHKPQRDNDRGWEPDPNEPPSPQSTSSSEPLECKSFTRKAASRAQLSRPNDEWASSFPANKKIIKDKENTPFLIRVPEDVDSSILSPPGQFSSEGEAIHRFFSREEATTSWHHLRRIQRMQQICKGSLFALTHPISPQTLPLRTNNILSSQTPKIWIDDRKFEGDRLEYARKYEKELTSKRLNEILSQKRLGNDKEDMIDVHRRLVCIENCDGPSIFALMLNAPLSQVSALGHLILQHLARYPKASMSIGVSPWWNKGFEMKFNLPYFAIGRTSRQGNRASVQGKHCLRSWHSLDFLSVNSDDDLDEQNSMRLNEKVVSLSIMGTSEHFWTGVCLRDESDDDESTSEEGEIEEDFEDDDGSDDPIHRKEASRPTISPRSYFLQALAENLTIIVDHQKEIDEIFEESVSAQHWKQLESLQNVRLWIKNAPRTINLVKRRVTQLKDQVHTFLKQAAISSDGFPKAPLLYSLRDEKCRLGIKSLKTIMQCYTDLCGIEEELKEYSETCNDLRKWLQTAELEERWGEMEERRIERKNKLEERRMELEERKMEIEERKVAELISRKQERSVFQIAVAALFMALFALMVQIYGVLPDNQRNYKVFMVFSVLFGVLSIIILIWVGLKLLFLNSGYAGAPRHRVRDCFSMC